MPLALVVGIYVVWGLAGVVLYLGGASANIMAMMIGAPIGWTIGIALILGFYWAKGWLA